MNCSGPSTIRSSHAGTRPASSSIARASGKGSSMPRSRSFWQAQAPHRLAGSLRAISRSSGRASLRLPWTSNAWM
ncbi:MAG: hypothetical protein KatS3mg103_0233 [Phycisphaerales bacterium]|nr:MAG: hypothetical protein KatS3mg103_0233 [Phycisphaerales bacterium]